MCLDPPASGLCGCCVCTAGVLLQVAHQGTKQDVGCWHHWPSILTWKVSFKDAGSCGTRSGLFSVEQPQEGCQRVMDAYPKNA